MILLISETLVSFFSRKLTSHHIMCFALYGIKTHRLSIEIYTNTFTFHDIGKLIYKKYLNENISQIIQRVLNRSNTRLIGFIILTN